MQHFYIAFVRIIAAAHLCLMGLNIAAVPLVIINEPFYIWAPLITFLVSPLVGGTYCIFNRLENFFRERAGMPLITDRIEELFNWRK